MQEGSLHIIYQDALARAKAAGEDISALEDAYRQYADAPDLVHMMNLRGEVSKYHPARIGDQSVWLALTSPYYGMDDFRWFLVQLGDMGDYFALNKSLFAYTQDFEAERNGTEYQVPVYFISGSDDWICPVDSVRDYYNALAAPSKDFTLIDGCGHNVQYSLPEDFAKAVK